MCSADDENPDGRGRSAGNPQEILLTGWRDIALRVWEQVNRDNLSVVAGGVAFFSMLSIFPALVAIVSLYGLISDPADVAAQVAALGGWLPQAAVDLINEQLSSIANADGQSLGIGLITAVLLAIWSATKGVKSLMSALNIVYGEEEERGFFSLNAIALLFTTSGLILVVVLLILIVGLTAALSVLPLPGWIAETVSAVRWPVLAGVALMAFGIGYRYGPSRRNARLQWLSHGAVFSTLLWLAASALFSFYVGNFGRYNELYGSLAGFIILLLWFYITAYIVLVGAEINAEIEHQTERDSTVGKDRPLGERGAHVADTVGEAR
jgi:membrane protein